MEVIEMKWETIKEWETRNEKEYPLWAYVWTYDAYGERWETGEWKDLKEYYIERRKKTEEQRKNNSMWDFQYEPMVLLPTDDYPKWGEGKSLVYNFENKEVNNE